MGLVQKIFYFHMPTAMLMLLSAIFCGLVSAAFLVTEAAGVRSRRRWPRPSSRCCTARSRWSPARSGRARRGACGGSGIARLTMSLLMWMIFVSYLLLRRYGGPGSEKLAAGLARVRHGERAVCLHLGERLAHDASEDVGGAHASGGFCAGRSGGRSPVSCFCIIVLLTARARLEAAACHGRSSVS